MTGNGHIDVEDLAMFALFLLGAEEAEQVRTHISTCPECRQELTRVRQDIALYAVATEPVALPEGARDRFLQQLDSTPQVAAPEARTPGHGAGMQVVPANAAVSRTRSPLVFTLGWAGWAVAAAITVVALGLHRERDALRSSLAEQSRQTATLEKNALALQKIFHGLSGPSAIKVSLTEPKVKASPSARATYDQGSGTLLLQAGNLAPLPPGKVYELWLIPANGKSPIPAGTFAPDAHGNANLLLSRMQDAVQAKAFGVTIEHAGGSPTPTLPIVLAGAPG